MRIRARSTHRSSELPRRWQLAGEWEHLLATVETGPVSGRWRVRPMSGQILAARAAIERLTEALYSPELVDPRGLAMARRLVRDGAGPVYDPRADRSLADALAECLDALDPSRRCAMSYGPADAHARRRARG